MIVNGFQRLAFPLILIIESILFIFYLNPNVLPMHDSLYMYQLFHSFYSNFSNFHELPLWLPYSGGFGLPSSILQILGLSPAQYFVGAVGFILHVKNTLILFKLSIFTAIFLYLLGVYFFTKICFESVYTRFIILLLAALSISWIWQISFNFYIFYLMPFVFYFQIKSIKTNQIQWLFVSVLVFVINGIGNTPYFLILQFYIDLFFLIPLIFFISDFKEYFNLKNIFRKEFFIAIIFSTIFLLILILACKNNLINISPARNIGSFLVSKQKFLTYGMTSLGERLYELMSGNIFVDDNTYYSGLLPLVCLIAGFFLIEDLVFIGLFSSILFVFSLAHGGVFARIFYYFPGMSFYRHIALTGGIFSVLIILSCGFFLERIFLIQPQKHVLSKLKIARSFLYGFLGLIIVDYCFTWKTGDLHFSGGRHAGVPHAFFLARLFVYFISFIFLIFYRKKPNNIKNLAYIFLVGAVLFDLGSYQLYGIKSLPIFNAKKLQSFFTVQRPSFSAIRVEKDVGIDLFEEQHHAVASAEALYSTPLYSFLAVDLCYPKYRLDILTFPVYKTLERVGAHPQATGIAFLGNASAEYRTYLGCESPKWRFYSNYMHVDKNAVDFSAVNPLNTLILQQSNETYGRDVPETSIKIGDALSTVNNISVLTFSPNKVDFIVRNLSKYDGYLSYADSYHPHWKAYRDGKQIPIWIANGGFKAVRVPPGIHRINFRYGTSLDWFSGYFLAVSGFCATLIFLFMFKKAMLSKV